jgi:hypothetical protein
VSELTAYGIAANAADEIVSMAYASETTPPYGWQESEISGGTV